VSRSPRPATLSAWAGPGQSTVLAVAASAAAAVLGNAFIGREAMRWFRELRKPRWQLPLPIFVAVGMVYYLILGRVLARSLARRDARATSWALTVMAGNELWNLVFFGRRSTRDGFLGLLVFLLPLAALQHAVGDDRSSRRALTPYTIYVLLYDLPWIHQLWKLNPSAPPTLEAPK